MLSASSIRVVSLVPTSFSNGALQLLKLVAVGLMTLDHVNTHLWGGGSQVAFYLGRVAMPIFAVVFAFNLARSGALDRLVFERLALRLIGFGALACVPYMALNGTWPLNILFTFLIALSVCLLVDRGRLRMATFCFLTGGVLVEYLWFGVALVVAAWWYFKQPSPLRMTVLILAWASLVAVNGNHWALLAIPVVSILSRSSLDLPRNRWAFYLYYPAHLAFIGMASWNWALSAGQ